MTNPEPMSGPERDGRAGRRPVGPRPLGPGLGRFGRVRRLRMRLFLRPAIFQGRGLALRSLARRQVARRRGALPRGPVDGPDGDRLLLEGLRQAPRPPKVLRPGRLLDRPRPRRRQPRPPPGRGPPSRGRGRGSSRRGGRLGRARPLRPDGRRFQRRAARTAGPGRWRKFLRYAGYAGLVLAAGHTALLKWASWTKYFRTFESVLPSLSLPVALFAAAAVLLRLAVWISGDGKDLRAISAFPGP